MAQSMTGFGVGSTQNPQWRCRVEVKSVNSRFSETRIHGLKDRMALEHSLLALVKKSFIRGKFDLICHQENIEKKELSTMDEKAFLMHAKNMKELAQRAGLAQPVDIASVLQSMPKTAVNGAKGSPPQTLFLQAAKQACSALMDSRGKEGDKLIQDIDQRLGCLQKLHIKVQKKTKSHLKEKKKNLQDRIHHWLDETVPLDKARLENELAVMIEKSDITEELVRLEAHFGSMHALIKRGAAKKGLGRELDFTIQEVNREINTIGAKMHDIQAAQAVIAMKQEVEKIREQAQNLE